MESPNASSRPSALSRLEVLPAEIRQIIYEYLGYPPPSNRIWIHRFYAMYCHHYKGRGILSKKERSQVQSARLCQVSTIRFLDAFGKDTVSLGTLVHTDPDYTAPRRVRGNEPLQAGAPLWHGKRPCWANCEYCRGASQWTRFETNMMCLNKRIHGELCHLLYSKVTVQFDFELSDRAVHSTNDVWLTGGRRYWAGHRHMGADFARMAISNSTMATLTRVALHKNIGTTTTTKTPSHTRYYYARVLRRQADSIRFIADHCRSLRALKYSPHVLAVQVCKQYQLHTISDAYKSLYKGCKSLESLEIEAAQHYRRCGCSTRDPHAVPDESSPTIREQIDIGPLGIDATRQIEDRVRNALLRIRWQKDLLIDCPKGPSNRPGTYHGDWSGGFCHKLDREGHRLPPE